MSLRADDVCHTHYHADYMGDMAVVWGSKFIVRPHTCPPPHTAGTSASERQPSCAPPHRRRRQVADAGECCDACKAHARVCGQKDGNGKPFYDKAPHPCGHEYEKACNMCALRPPCIHSPGTTIRLSSDGSTGEHSCRWVFCDGGGSKTDNRCFSFDIHNHTHGECWLKRQVGGASASSPPPRALRPFPDALADECGKRPFTPRSQADPTRPTVGDENRYPAKMRAAKREIWPWAVDEKLWPWEMPEKARCLCNSLFDSASASSCAPPAQILRGAECSRCVVRCCRCTGSRAC